MCGLEDRSTQVVSVHGGPWKPNQSGWWSASSPRSSRSQPLIYVPLLCTVPGTSQVLAYTIAAELGDINRFSSSRKLAGYGGLCPCVYQSGERDLHGPLAKQGRRYLHWAPRRLPRKPLRIVRFVEGTNPSPLRQTGPGPHHEALLED
jgi:hypothetical protein